MIRPPTLLSVLLGVCLSVKGNPSEANPHHAPPHEAEAPATPATPVEHTDESDRTPDPVAADHAKHDEPASHAPAPEAPAAHVTEHRSETHAEPPRAPALGEEEVHAVVGHEAPSDTAKKLKALTQGDAHAMDSHEHTDAPLNNAVGAEELKSFLRIGELKSAQGDYESAEIAYRQVLAARATPAQDRDALMGLARVYRRKNQMTRAAAVYEKIIKEYPSDNQLPVVYLELGRTQRALGAYRLAIGRFYSVINSTLKLPEEGTETYRQLARTAQFEVAETYFVAGNYEEAAQFFSRLKLLDLTPADQARAHFKSAYAYNMGGEYEKAVASLRSFLELHPDDENTPEARYLLSVSLRRLDRNKESLAAALELLKTERGRMSDDPKRWAYWQRKTGNQLANEFYEQGDAPSALSIYLSLASLSDEPIWRLPVLYQVGLCYERMRAEPKAREYYGIIVSSAKTQAALPNPRTELADLSAMAAWRLKHLDWETSTERQLNTFFQTPEFPQPPTVALAEPGLPKT